MQMAREKQWWMIGGGYAAVTVYAADLLYTRHQNMLNDPTIASSGMYAFGDLLTVVFLFLLYAVPTVFVLRLLAQDVRIYSIYAHALLLVSLTAPLALVVIVLNSLVKGHMFQDLAGWRLLCSPVVLMVMGVSRWFASSAVAKRFMNYALLAESATFLISLAQLMLAVFGVDVHFTN